MKLNGFQIKTFAHHHCKITFIFSPISQCHAVFRVVFMFDIPIVQPHTNPENTQNELTTLIIEVSIIIL